MSINIIINILGILIGVAASLTNIWIYSWAKHNTIRDIRTTEGINLFTTISVIIAILMILIAMISYKNSYPPIVDIIIFVANIVFIAAFIYFQTFYLTKRRNQLKQEIREKQRQYKRFALISQSLPDNSTTIEPSQAYREAISKDLHITNLQIMDMSYPLNLMDTYVDLQVAKVESDPSPFVFDFHVKKERSDPIELLESDQWFLEHSIKRTMNPEEAIRTYKFCVITGDPGVGKTTLLKYLVLKSAGRQLKDLPDIPIYIELNAFARSGKQDLLDFASDVWNERYGFPKEEASNFIEVNLKERKILFLLDALDEVIIGDTTNKAESSYQKVTQAIMKIANDHHHTPIVVTTRKASYEQRTRLTNFTELEVLGFRPKDIEQFVKQWFSRRQTRNAIAKASDLNVKLMQDLRLRTLATNPLLLSLISIVYEAQLDLPDRRAELYRRCVDTLLIQWDASRDIRRRHQFESENKKYLLGEIAWYFHVRKQPYFPENLLLEVIGNFLPAIGSSSEQNRKILEEITDGTGLLKKQAKGWYSFLHLSFQEYLAAQQVDRQNHLSILLQSRNDPWWREVTLLYAGSTLDSSELFKKLVGREEEDHLQEDIFSTNLNLAGNCLITYPTIKRQYLREETITRLLNTLRKTPYSLTREQVANTLVEIGRMEVNKRLLEKLSTDQVNLDVGSNVIDVLSRLGERSVTTALLELLFNSQIEAATRVEIAKALSNLGEHLEAIELMRLLTDEKLDSSVRGRIADAIGAIGDRSVVPGLMQLLTDEKLDSSVRMDITDTLSSLGEHNLDPKLLNLLLSNQKTSNKSKSIANTKITQGEQSPAPKLLVWLLDTQIDQDTRWHVAYALGKLGERSVIPELKRQLSNPKIHSDINMCSTFTLAMLGEHTVTPMLLPLLSNRQIEVDIRIRIANTLNQLVKDEHTIYSLARLLQESDIADTIHRTLWSICRRMGVTVYITDELGSKKIKVIKWGNEPS